MAHQTESDPFDVHIEGSLVLVVDDDPNVRQIITAFLERAGFDVLAAVSGPDALSILARTARPVRALISDIDMPGMSGIELARRTRESRAKLPVLFVSGEPLPDKGVFGDHEFLSKPFNGHTLVSRVRSIVSRSAMLG